MINLTRPLAVLDLEATSTDPKEARIIQIAVKRLEPGTEETNGPIGCDPFVHLVNPPCDIPGHVMELTGIEEYQIRDAPPFSEVSKYLRRFIQDVDLAGYNIESYDWPLLQAEYARLDKSVPGPSNRRIVDAYQLEQCLRPRTLGAVYQRRFGDTLEDAHDAGADVRATEAILLNQCDEVSSTNSGVVPTPESLVNFQRGDYLDAERKLKETERGVEVCFGKHQGKTLSELSAADPNYLDWMYQEIDSLRTHIDKALG